MPRWLRVPLLGWCLLGAGPFALAVLLVGVAQTWRGHLFGVVGAGLVAAPVLVLVRRSRALAVGCGFALVLGLGGLVAAVPSPRAPAQHGAWAEGPPQLGLPTLLPEIDQLVLGTYLIGFVDPLITVAGSRHVREAFLSVYRPMLADPQFAALPTQLTQAYRGTTEPQRFVYVPEHAPGERLPCVVFLHGSAGNFQGYLWLWKQLADRGHFVVVAPGFGFGNWQRPGGVDAVREARREAERTLPVDPARFVLAGLSNGGRGVMRVIEEDPGRTWKAVVLLSAVVDLEPSPEAWADRPTLVVHGLRDDRISAHWLDVSVDLLRRAGAQVSLKTDPDEDHFLVFSRPEEVSGWVLEFLTPWLGPVEAHAPRGPP